MTVEQAAIEVASAYAAANGYEAGDRRAVGLVLAGMAIASCATIAAQRELVRGYLEQFPAHQPPISGWARRLSEAAR